MPKKNKIHETEKSCVFFLNMQVQSYKDCLLEKKTKNKHTTTSIHLVYIYIYVREMNIYACKRKTHRHTQSYCGSKKSVVGFVVDVELFGSLIVVWLIFISFVFPGFFITVTRPQY